MSTIVFAWPWLLAVLPLPWLLRVVFTPVDAGTALHVPSLPAAAMPYAAPHRSLPLRLAALAWLLLVIAAARPQMPVGVTPQAVSGRDLMLAFDVSLSMSTKDMRNDGNIVDRLQAARLLAEDFIERRHGDRVGLIVFGAQAYLHTPLTFDVQAVRATLATTEPGLAGRETALGDAIALATKHLMALPENKRVLVLLTDGANTAGTLSPERAAWLARRENMRIHAIGIGSSHELDEATLKNISAQTGGMYRRATDSKAIAQFLADIDRAEPLGHDIVTTQVMGELYFWPLSLALLLVCAIALYRVREVTP